MSCRKPQRMLGTDDRREAEGRAQQEGGPQGCPEAHDRAAGIKRKNTAAIRWLVSDSRETAASMEAAKANE